MCSYTASTRTSSRASTSATCAFPRTPSSPTSRGSAASRCPAIRDARPWGSATTTSASRHPTYCVRFRGGRFYPEELLKLIDVRSGFDAGKDIQLGAPVRPGDTIEVRSTVHEVYEKTGRTGSMVFVVIRYTLSNQRGDMLAIVDNRFMHR